MGDKKAFDSAQIKQLNKKALKLLNEGVLIEKKLKTSIQELQRIVQEIPQEAKDFRIPEAIEKVRSGLKISEIEKQKSRLQKQLDRAGENTIEFDEKTEKMVQDLLKQVNKLETQVKQYHQLFSNGKITGSYDNFLKSLNEINKEVTGLETALEKCQKQAEGLKDVASEYSPDPVNLATGNFAYEKKDLECVGTGGLNFIRSYNALDLEEGAMGLGWHHNFEISLTLEPDDDMKLVMEDGHAEYFHSADGILYRPIYGSGMKLKKTPSGYEVRTRELDIYDFDSGGMVQKITDRNGLETEFVYENGKLSAVSSCGRRFFFIYNRQNYLAKVSDYLGRSVTYEYKDGRLTEIQDVLENVFQYIYNDDGLLCSIVNPRGIITVKNEFDDLGRPIQQEFPDGGKMSYEYQDQEKKITLIEQNGSRTQYFHNDQFCNTKVIYEDGAKEEFVYDKKRRKVQETDANGSSTKYAYDSRGNMTSVVDPLGNELRVCFDLRNQPEEIWLNGQCREKNRYDRKGNLLSSSDALGRKTEFYYDQKGQPTEIIQPDGSKIHMDYDSCGSITRIQDAFGSETSYEYDQAHRVIKTIDPSGNIYQYTYNQANDIESVTDPSGNIRTYQYNKSRKVKKIIHFNGAEVEIVYNCLNKPERVMQGR